MSVQEIDNFRAKYPGAYTDKTDAEIAQALADRYGKVYSFLPDKVARDTVISGYNPGTQESARMAETRPNMWKQLGEELAYQPALDKNLSIANRAKAMVLKNPTTALKALGALGQSEEGLLSSAVVAAQRGQNPMQGDFYKTIGRSVSGQAPTEYGDIGRNAGLPESVNQVGGLLTGAAIPGWGGVVGKTNQALKRLGRATGEATEAGQRAVVKAHLTMLTREHPDAAARAIGKNFSMIKPGQSVSSIEGEVSNAVAKADRSARAMQRRASTVYNYGLNKVKGTEVLLNDKNLKSIPQEALKAGQEGLGLEYVTKGKVGREVTKLKGNKNIPGSDTLASIIDDLNQSPTMTVGKLRVKLAELDGLIEKAGDSAGTKAVRAQASRLSSQIREAINTQSPEMAAFNTKYQGMVKYLNPDEANKLPGIVDLLKQKQEGGTRLSNYFELGPEAKKVLNEFNAQLPKGRQFMDELLDASTNASFKQLKPKAGFSLLGPAAAGISLVTNPAYLPALGVGIGLASPRASALAYKGSADLATKANKVRAAMVGKPITQAKEILSARGMLNAAVQVGQGATKRGLIAPAVAKGMTQGIFDDNQE